MNAINLRVRTLAKAVSASGLPLMVAAGMLVVAAVLSHVHSASVQREEQLVLDTMLMLHQNTAASWHP